MKSANVHGQFRPSVPTFARRHPSQSAPRTASHPPLPGMDGGPDAPVHLPGEQHRRQRPRLAPPGDPRFQRCRRSDEHDRLRHLGDRRANDRSALSLPAITNPVLIDGYSQPGYAGTPLIELSGSQAGGGDGLTITGSDVTVRGLDINSFSQGAGIHLTGTGATGDWIYGNFLGTDPTGTQAEPNDAASRSTGGPANNLIGTNGDGVNDAAERNLISAATCSPASGSPAKARMATPSRATSSARASPGMSP